MITLFGNDMIWYWTFPILAILFREWNERLLNRRENEAVRIVPTNFSLGFQRRTKLLLEIDQLVGLSWYYEIRLLLEEWRRVEYVDDEKREAGLNRLSPGNRKQRNRLRPLRSPSIASRHRTSTTLSYARFLVHTPTLFQRTKGSKACQSGYPYPNKTTINFLSSCSCCGFFGNNVDSLVYGSSRRSTTES